MPEPQDDPRVYFAAERTFLAWIRTGLGLMGIGFTVSRFGLFLRQLHAGAAAPAPLHGNSFSVYAGVALVVLGTGVLVAAGAQHRRTVRELRQGTWMPGVARSAVALALVLAVGGVGMALFLLVAR